MKLTDLAIRALKAPEKRQRTYVDETLKGVGVRSATMCLWRLIGR
jgi:hypothetical protein